MPAPGGPAASLGFRRFQLAVGFPQRILVTSGAGFVGGSLCVAIRRAHPKVDVVALDSLKRRGSELNLARLRDAGVSFVHGDVRNRGDLLGGESVQAIVECSAEPSVLAGTGGGGGLVFPTKLLRAPKCPWLGRRDRAPGGVPSASRIFPGA